MGGREVRVCRTLICSMSFANKISKIGLKCFKSIPTPLSQREGVPLKTLIIPKYQLLNVGYRTPERLQFFFLVSYVFVTKMT